MECERRLVREDSDTLGPEPRAYELLVLAGGKMDNAVDAALDAYDTPARQVMDEKLRRVTSLCRLLGREQSLLGGRDLVEAIPVGMCFRQGLHAQNVSCALGLCKSSARTKIK